MVRPDYRFEKDPEDTDTWDSDPFNDVRVTVPLGTIEDFPRKCVEISDEYVPIIIAALERLKYGDMWAGDQADIDRAYDNISQLQTNLMDGNCTGGNMNYECLDLPLYSPIVDWLPADPFDSGASLPLGYTLPPWQIVPFDQPLEGLKAGDVIVNLITALTAFPPFIPLSGVPRLQITVQGPAEIDIEFVRVLQGGIAVVLLDGVPHHWYDCQLYNIGDLLNVNSWLEVFGFVIDTFTRPQLQDSIKLPLAQEYTIEVQMFPRPALDFSLGYGGGIRAIQVCSAEEQIDLTQFVTDIRTNGGNLEVEIDGGWLDRGPVDLDDIQDETDLRANGCKLQAYDLATASWVDIPDTNFYRTDVLCNILHEVVIDLDADGWGVRQFDAIGLANARFGSFNERVYLYGQEGWIMQTGDLSFFGLVSPNQFFMRDSGTGALNDAMFSIRSNAAKTALSVHASHASAPNIQQWRDSADVIVAELAQSGWFSAMQQLIVNDLTSTSVKRAQGRLLGQWVDDTDSIRKGAIELQVDDFIGVRTAIRAEANGNETELGFHGTAPVVQPVVTTDIADMEDMERLILDALGDNGLINWDWTTVPGGVLWSYLHTHYDPKEGLDSWAAVSPNFCGSYTTSFGWQNVYDCEFSNSILRIGFDPGLSVTYNEIRYKINVLDNATFPLTIRLEDDTFFVMKQDTLIAGNTGIFEFTWTGTRGFRNVYLRLTSATSDAVFRVIEVQISGTITRPNIEVGYILQ